MLLLVFAAISAPMLLVSCAKKKKKEPKKEISKEFVVEEPAKCNHVYPDNNEILCTRRHKYKIMYKIYCSSVFWAIRLSDKLKVAIKCELMSEENKYLDENCRLLRQVHRLKSRHFPVLYDQGKAEGRFSFVVMELLNATLHELLPACEECPSYRDDFSCGTTLKIAQQCLIAIEHLHRAGFIHCDIRPRNFVMGYRMDCEYYGSDVLYNNNNTVYLMGYDFAREYVDKTTNRIVKPRQNVCFCGTLAYTSLDVMDGMEPSRKDDLESWLYMIMDFAHGDLPWDYVEGKGKIRQAKWELRNWNTDISKKYFDKEFQKKLPLQQFKKLFDYIVQLDYYASPDYELINYILWEMMMIKKVKWSEALDFNQHEYKGQNLRDPDLPDFSYTDTVEVPGNGQPPGFQETPLKDRVKLKRYIPEIEEEKKEESKQTTSTEPVK